MIDEQGWVGYCIFCKHALRLVDEYDEQWLEDLDGMATCFSEPDGEYYPHITNDDPRYS